MVCLLSVKGFTIAVLQAQGAHSTQSLSVEKRPVGGTECVTMTLTVSVLMD